MERYVVSRELAEKLKAAGYPQDGQFYWHSLISHDMKRWSEYRLQDYKPDSDFGMRVFAAPLSDELLESEGIPDGLIIHSDREDGDIVYWGGMVFKGQWHDEDGWHQSLANALAELWIWCVENKYIQGDK